MLSYGNMYPSIIFNIEVFSRFRNKPFLSIVPYAHLLGIVAEILQPLVIGIHVFVLRAFTFSSLLRVYQIVKPVFIKVKGFCIKILEIISFIFPNGKNNT
jgi:long-subunit acyl-CoA synthetase (AMP-forming)